MAEIGIDRPGADFSPGIGIQTDGGFFFLD